MGVPFHADSAAFVKGPVFGPMHERLLSDGFRLAAKAQGRRRADGTIRVRLIWRRRAGKCSVVVSQSFVVGKTGASLAVETPKLNFFHLGSISAPDA
jgi:hypothetical protein